MGYEFPQGTFVENDKGQIRYVRMGQVFFPEDWFRMCARRDDLGYPESFYVGGCCGNTSAAQDTLNHIMRMNSQGLSAYEIRNNLAEYHDLMRNHDGYNREDMPDLAEHAETDPVARMLLLYETVKDKVEPGRERPYARDYDPEDPKDALKIVDTHASALSLSLFWDRPPEGEEPSHMTRAWRAERLGKLLPAIRTLHLELGKMDLVPFEGWAIVSGDEVGQARGGPAVFGDRKEANETAKAWNESQKKSRDSRQEGEETPEYMTREFSVRACRVSLENGVEVR